jgi:tetratricopeptide (TPR) repeat protein
MRRWPPAMRRRVGWTAVAVSVAILVALVFRDRMADVLYPEARAQQLHAAAEVALAEGRLTAADGSGARELYAAALALDPDRNEARLGLRRVGTVALERADAATQARRFDDARAALQIARDVGMPGVRVDAAAERLRAREADVAGLDAMLERARAAQAAGRLDDDAQSALPLYQRVLALQPRHAQALEGREDALSDLLQRAATLREQGRHAEAVALVARVRHYDPGHVGLPDAQAALSQAGDAARRRADRALRSGRLTDAAHGYAEALLLEPDDAAALAGRGRVANAWAARSEHQASDFRFPEAERSLAQARALAPEAAAVSDAERHLAQARQRATQLPTAKVTPRRAAEVRRLVAAAAEAEARGELLAPPGESAYDRLRQARALAPNDASVRRALARLLPAARSCFDVALRANQLVRAQGCLDARVQLGEGAVALRAARTRLAARWIAVGEERLGAGELAAAQRAVTSARALDPDAEGLAGFAERTRAAARAAEANR